MKKVVKVLAILLMVALVASVFIGAGAATISGTAKVEVAGEEVNGTLVPGETVDSTITFPIDVSKLAVGDSLTIDTPLDDWVANLKVAGKTLTFEEDITSKRPSIDCFNFLNVGADAKVTVVCSGTIPASKGGSSIVPLTVTVKSVDSSVGGTVTTKTVTVYNSNNLEKDKSTVAQQISTLTQRIAKYNTPEVVNLGIFFTIPERYVSDAENCLSMAQRSGISDYMASKYMLEATNKIEIADKSIKELTLEVAKAKLAQVNSLITDLKGLNRDVDNISTKYTVYEGTLAGFTTETDNEKIDELIANIDELYNEAALKLDPSSVAPEFPEWLPWVIIAGIGAIVIAIVIILIVRRHKKNSWDELG